MALNKSIKELLHRLEANPHDEQHQKEVQDIFAKHPAAVFSALKEHKPSSAKQPKSSGPPNPPTDADWVNCVGQQKCTPLKKVKPESLKDLVSIVSEAHKTKQRVRAVGSGHAFSDIARTDDAILVNPILLD